MIYAIYDGPQRLGAASRREDAEREARYIARLRCRHVAGYDEPGPMELSEHMLEIREEPGEAWPSGRPSRAEAIAIIHLSLDRAAARGDIETETHNARNA